MCQKEKKPLKNFWCSNEKSLIRKLSHSSNHMLPYSSYCLSLRVTNQHLQLLLSIELVLGLPPLLVPSGSLDVDIAWTFELLKLKLSLTELDVFKRLQLCGLVWKLLGFKNTPRQVNVNSRHGVNNIKKINTCNYHYKGVKNTAKTDLFFYYEKHISAHIFRFVYNKTLKLACDSLWHV